MDILYINVIEQNAGWGAETFLNNGFQLLGHNVTNLDFRKHRQVLATKLKQVPDFDVLFLQRGDRFPPYLLKSCNRPKVFWATELISRNRDQDILLKSNLFDHIFVRSDDCKKRALNNKWVDANNISVMLSGFDADLHKKSSLQKILMCYLLVQCYPEEKKFSENFNLNLISKFVRLMEKKWSNYLIGPK